MDYLEDLEVADQVVLNFCKNKVAPTSITHDPKGGKTKINIGLPIEYREGRIMGVLHHEIGTHFLRKYNEKNQVWYKKRDKYELKNCIQTEEGFASINQLFEMVTYDLTLISSSFQCKDDTKKPFLYKAALNYSCVLQQRCPQGWDTSDPQPLHEPWQQPSVQKSVLQMYALDSSCPKMLFPSPFHLICPICC